MGIYNRDYLRDDDAGRSRGSFRGSFGSGGDGWAIRYLLIANIVVFLLQVLIPGLTGWLSLSLANLETGQLWRVLTYGFCHSQTAITHILFNMYALWLFGRLIEPIYGSREFLALYLCGIVFSGLGHLIFQAATGAPNPTVGASGGVNTIVILAAMIYPRQKILFMFFIPMEFRVMAALYIGIDLFGLVNPGSGVAHAAHLAGALFGFLYRSRGWRITGPWVDRLLSGKFSLRRKPRVKIFNPGDESDSSPSDMTSAVTSASLDERVDAILDKIAREGEASLTDAERETLREASRRAATRKRL